MLKYGNKEFRNLQEQVEENMKDIENLKEGVVVLDEFGIKVVGEVESIDDLPTVEEYKEAHEDWSYGDAYAIGEETPYSLYILTRANSENPDDYWFDIGVFPMPGPQGEQGIQGPVGPQGQTGPQGDSAGFGTVSATATTLPSGSSATASVTTSGPDTAKEFAFTFGIPQNTPAEFTHYITITASTVVGSQVTGTLGQSEYNKLYDNYDSVVRLRSSNSLANIYYFLKRWSVNDDYMRYVGLWSLNDETRYFLFTVDRSNRNWTLDVGQPLKVSSYSVNSGSATSGQVLTADGNGGATWTTPSGVGTQVVTLTTTTGTLSNDDYLKVSGDSCVIVYDDNTTKVTFRKYDEDSSYINYAMAMGEGSNTYWYGVNITKSTKAYAVQSNYISITNASIKSGSTTANQYLTSDGSGGTSWTSGPSFTQVQSDWTQTNTSAVDYIKNKPTIPTIPVTDVQINGTSIVSSDVANVVTEGTYNASTNKVATMSDVPSTKDIEFGDLITSVNVDNLPYVDDPTYADPSLPLYLGSFDFCCDYNKYSDYIDLYYDISGTPGSGMYFKGSLMHTGYTMSVELPNETVVYGSIYGLVGEAGYQPPNIQFVLYNPTYTEGITSEPELNLSLPTHIWAYQQYGSSISLGYVCDLRTSTINKDDLPDLSNVVTTDTQQTISGNKAITGKIKSSVGSTYGLVVPTTTSYTADKTIATTSDVASVADFICGKLIAEFSTGDLPYNVSSFPSADVPLYLGSFDLGIDTREGSIYNQSPLYQSISIYYDEQGFGTGLVRTYLFGASASGSGFPSQLDVTLPNQTVVTGDVYIPGNSTWQNLALIFYSDTPSGEVNFSGKTHIWAYLRSPVQPSDDIPFQIRTKSLFGLSDAV